MIFDYMEKMCKLDFINRPRGDKSGAYLFLPDGEARVIQAERPKVKVVEGKVISYVEVFLPFAKHVVTLKTSPGANIYFF